MFVGLQINYVTGGNIAYLGNNAEFEDFAKADKYAINDESQRRVTINNWGAHLLVGFDYEYLGGFQLGLEYGRGLSSLAKCGSEDFNWTFKPYLGYNFAKLFN